MTGASVAVHPEAPHPRTMTPLLALLCLPALTATLPLGPEPPTRDPAQRCDSPPCSRTSVKVKVYIADRLWEQYSAWQEWQDAGQSSPSIAERVGGVLEGINHLLARLENGGFRVVTDGSVIKLGSSNIVMGETYVDRGDGNTTKTYDEYEHLATTFTFQEAVFNLPAAVREEVNLRVVFMPRDYYGPSGTAEEQCICNQHPLFNYGCIAVFGVGDLSDWYSPIFAHELGHALGYAVHDDSYYSHSAGDSLVMWPQVGPSATV